MSWTDVPSYMNTSRKNEDPFALDTTQPLLWGESDKVDDDFLHFLQNEFGSDAQEYSLADSLMDGVVGGRSSDFPIDFSDARQLLPVANNNSETAQNTTLGRGYGALGAGGFYPQAVNTYGDRLKESTNTTDRPSKWAEASWPAAPYNTTTSSSADSGFDRVSGSQAGGGESTCEGTSETVAVTGSTNKRKAPEVDWRSITDPVERRHQRRLAKNRVTAARSRDRKKEQWTVMDAGMRELREQNASLKASLAGVLRDNATLKQQLASLNRGASASRSSGEAEPAALGLLSLATLPTCPLLIPAELLSTVLVCVCVVLVLTLVHSSWKAGTFAFLGGPRLLKLSAQGALENRGTEVVDPSKSVYHHPGTKGLTKDGRIFGKVSLGAFMGWLHRGCIGVGKLMRGRQRLCALSL